MILPPRNFAKRGRDNRLRSPSHLAFVRKHLCVLWETGDCHGKVEACHARDVAPLGHGGAKPDDTYTFSACSRHHRESEKREGAWGWEHGIDVLALCLEFASKSPDAAIRAAAHALQRGKLHDIGAGSG